MIKPIVKDVFFLEQKSDPATPGDAQTGQYFQDTFQIASQSHDAGLVFITHSHYDHFCPESVSKVSKADTVFIAPAGMEHEIRKAAGDAELILMEPGDTREIFRKYVDQAIVVEARL